MAVTYTLISTTSGSTSSYVFSNIPSTYTDLAMLVSARQTDSNGVMFIKFNSDTGSNYNMYYTDNQGATPPRFFTSSTTKFEWGATVNSSYTANSYSTSFLYIPNYASSNNKTATAEGCDQDWTAASSGSYLNFTGLLYTNTAAISSITVSAYAASFATYTTISLYGIKKS